MRGKGILLDDGLDLQIKPVYDTNGKITKGVVIGNSIYQNQALILITNQGEWKLSPLVGVGIETLLMTKDYAALRREIRKQMERDGQQVKDVIFSPNNKLTIDADYSKG